MNSFEVNKVVGAVLGTCLLVLGIGVVSGQIYHTVIPGEQAAEAAPNVATPAAAEKPAADAHDAHAVKPGYIIAVDDPAEAGKPAAGQAAAATVESIGARLAKADAAAGQAESKACAACHDFSKDGPNKIGPNLYAVVDRPIASHPGFQYSDALKGKAGDKWSYEHLDSFLASPKTFAAGTKMTFQGIADPNKRAALIAYLSTLADTPVPFPAP